MKRVLLTGMSGTGKSSVTRELAPRGYRAVDTDDGEWCECVAFRHIPGVPDPPDVPDSEWVWREDRIQALLSTEDADVLFVSGCASNMRKFYPQFDHIILLSASPDVIIERLAKRVNNPYGKDPVELARVLHYLATVEPVLRKRAGHEIDTGAPLDQVVAAVLEIAQG